MSKEIDYDYEHSIERREGLDFSKENLPEIQPKYSITDNNSNTTANGDTNDQQQINDTVDMLEEREDLDYAKDDFPEIQSNYPIPDTSSEKTAIGDAKDVQQINDAVDMLQKTDKGRDILGEISGNSTSIKFDEIDAVAQFNPTGNEISLNGDLRDADPSVLAAHLAHEGTHVQWYAQGLTDSIDQEYHAFKNEKEVWDQVKDGNIDEQCDWVSSMIDQGEADAKMQIRLMYSHLPEYA